MIRSLLCSRCRLEPRQGRQRWCRPCRTTHERERRRRRRQLAPQGPRAPEPVGPVLPPGIADLGWGIEVCGARHQPGFSGRPCGQPFPARRSGQGYCCKGHGAGQVAHSADCPLLQARLARQASPVPPRQVERPAVVAAPPAAASIRVAPTPTRAPKGKRGRLWDPATVERLKVWIADIPKRARPPEVIRVSSIPLSGGYADLRVYRGGFPTRLGLVLHFDLLPDVIEALQDALQRRGSAPDRLAGRGGTRDEWTESVTGDVDGWATEGTSPGPAVDGRWDIDDGWGLWR